MTDIDTIISEIKSKSNGRTRYEGQKPFWDEMLVDEIERLRVILDKISFMEGRDGMDDHEFTKRVLDLVNHG